MSDIAVILPYYNAERTIAQAVDSVTSSTVPVDLFIIDDGSAKPLAEIIDVPENCEIIRFPENKGLVAGLNHGLKVVQERSYKYIARMDADDICEPERFAKQRAFMEENPDIALVGAWAVFIDEDTEAPVFWYNPPSAPEDARKALANNSPVLHPTWFMRTGVLDRVEGYRSLYPAAEDYDFLCRLVKTDRIANIPDYLLRYRISSQGVSVSRRAQQLRDRLAIQWEQGDRLSPRVWIGMLRTILFFVLPMQMIQRIKQLLYKKQAGS